MRERRKKTRESERVGARLEDGILCALWSLVRKVTQG
jgi:hypothetical protein